MKKNYKKYFDINKETWNKKVGIHSKSEFYDIEGFKNGNTSLNAFELEELSDVEGKYLLHLQCHFGQDTLSWSRLGAKCTGIDLSNEGIELAKKLNLELGLDATFIESNLSDLSVALLGKERLIDKLTIPIKNELSEIIIPTIKNFLTLNGITFKDISTLVIGCGPGSFTGIRGVVAAAKGIQISNVYMKVIGINSLAALANRKG